ncbi:MAG: orotate phosphoribosyltransferase [Verrucomicrobiales bacterium]|nr:orotate phosphoribosyltransferase [Verrucomicrobiales bacterium]|tara:strand:- start:2819 stop:3430 length:612 start_codon:yes stop_codon:yes gene_type:complete
MLNRLDRRPQANTNKTANLNAVNNSFSTSDDLVALGARIVGAAYLEGDFVLRSGRRSRYYLDKYRFTTEPGLLQDIAQALSPRIPKETQRVAGPELGAVPLATALSLATNLPSILVRAEAKGYGTSRRFEGILEKDDNVVLVEDVLTTGGQAVESAQALRDAGANILLVIGIVDREEGAKEAMERAGFRFDALFTSTSLGLVT